MSVTSVDVIGMDIWASCFEPTLWGSDALA